MRIALAIAGILTLGLCWLGPLPHLAQSAFFAHMLMHMTVVAVGAGLLALAIAGTRWDPVPKAPKLFSPIIASLVELVIVWTWHAPGLHHMARHGTLGFLAEQGMFLLCGLWLWLSAFGGESPRSGARAASGVIGLLLTSMHMTVLGALLIFATRPLYEHAHSHGMELDPLFDQQLGGAIMILVGGATYLAGGLWLTANLLRGSEVELQNKAI